MLEDGERLPPVRVSRIERVAQPAPPWVGVRRPGDGDESSLPRGVLAPTRENPVVERTQQLARVGPRGDPGARLCGVERVDVDPDVAEGGDVLGVHLGLVEVDGEVGVDLREPLDQAAIRLGRLGRGPLAGDGCEERLDSAAEFAPFAILIQEHLGAFGRRVRLGPPGVIARPRPGLAAQEGGLFEGFVDLAGRLRHSGRPVADRPDPTACDDQGGRQHRRGQGHGQDAAAAAPLGRALPRPAPLPATRPS